MDLVSISVQKDKSVLTLSQFIPELDQDINYIGIQAANQAGLVALKAFKSVVPVFSRQLRDDHIEIDYSRSNQKDPKVRVFVSEKIHDKSPRPTGPKKSYLSSPELALELDVGRHPFSGKQMKRSQASIPFPGYASISGPTAGWIEQGYLQTLEMLDRLD